MVWGVVGSLLAGVALGAGGVWLTLRDDVVRLNATMVAVQQSIESSRFQREELERELKETQRQLSAATTDLVRLIARLEATR